MLKTGYIIIVCAFLVLSCKEKNNTALLFEKELDTGWQFNREGSSEMHPATVPGCVHTDLLSIGLIEDPFTGENEKKLQWIEKEIWEYSCRFMLDPSTLNSYKHYELVFDGLDTYAKVYLNNRQILTADNMFRVWTVDCSDLLKETNDIRIEFLPADSINSLKESEYPCKLPDKRAFTRKAPYQFGWDWGPRYVTCGVWRPVKILAWSDARILDFQIVQNDIDIKNACMEAKLNIISDKSFTAIIEIRDSANNLFAQKEINLKPGNNDCSVKFNIPEPKLWWCNGKGEQPLYKISAGLLKDNAVLDCKNMTTGLREIELVQENDSIGRSFFFTLNGKQVYIKGANYIPQDNFPSRVGADVYKRIIADAREAGINMLRVWGGGIYEEDIFYDLCDQNGIMVWQDFMFSCNMYPGDKDFLSNVENEVNQNIQRLRNHACIAVWCGNNEVENGWNDWEWQKLLGYSTEDSQKVWNDYQELFYQLIPRLVRENDPGRQYIPTSPQYGWGHQENFTRGDSHYWGVWWGMEPFEVYNEKFGRFMSEYGFQSMPDMRTIRFFAGDSVISVSDPVILSHQKHSEGFETIHKYMERDYPVPESLDEFVYVSQMLQAEGMKTAIEAHRRNMPVCMGTLFWQFNDCWPVTSWSGIDFFGRKKALYYFLKKLYLNVIGSVYENNGYTELYIINDGFQETDYNVELKIMGFNGNTLWSDTINGHTCANSSAVVYSLRTSDILAGLNPNSILLHYCILSGDVRKYTGNFYFAKTKELDIKPTDIDTAWVHVNGEYMLKLETSYLIKNLQIFSDDIDIECSDNYFDVIPGYPEQVKITVIEGSFSPLKIKFRSIGDIR